MLSLKFYDNESFDMSDMEAFMTRNGYQLTYTDSKLYPEKMDVPIGEIHIFKILKNDQTEDKNNIGKEINSIIRKLDRLNLKNNHLFEEVNFSISLY